MTRKTKDDEASTERARSFRNAGESAPDAPKYSKNSEGTSDAPEYSKNSEVAQDRPKYSKNSEVSPRERPLARWLRTHPELRQKLAGQRIALHIGRLEVVAHGAHLVDVIRILSDADRRDPEVVFTRVPALARDAT